ncbi:zinc ribbon domain-containing protein [Methanobrevibacter sp. UBA188]|uniref:zinc ribbon domain-containing protein n=1 Tax=Methanobrevibacter sp. UBA188 TaxID=1915473 RepID=UPI0025D9B6ED|nr:zinc ribbon domain-containing protein [Methanobrevibacter sp. UBA188]
MGKIYCTECGAELDDSVKFCSSCGKNVKGDAPINSSDEFIEKIEIIPIIVGVLIPIIGYLIFSSYLPQQYIILIVIASSLLMGLLCHESIKFAIIYGVIAGIIVGFILSYWNLGVEFGAVMLFMIIMTLGSFIGKIIREKI